MIKRIEGSVAMRAPVTMTIPVLCLVIPLALAFTLPPLYICSSGNTFSG